MRVFNQYKTQELTEYDLTKGYLKDDTLTTHIKAVEGVEEQGHYVLIAENKKTGGKEYEYVVDVPKVEAVKEHDKVENIQVYISYSEKELLKIKAENERTRLKAELANTDYQAIKYAEGWITDEEYAPIKAERESLREKIRDLESQLLN